MQCDTKRLGWAWVLAATLLWPALGGCAQLRDALGSVQKPSASVTGVGFDDVKLDAMTLRFDIEVANPYDVPLPLADIDYSLASLAQPFLSGKAGLQGAVPAMGKQTFSLPARITYAELLKVLKDVRPGAVVPYKAELGLSVNAPVVGPLRLPLTKEGRLPIPTLPEVEVSEIKWNTMSLDEAAGHVILRIVNRNQFPIDLSKLTYALSLGDVEVANSTLAKAVPFAAGGGASTVEIPISFSPKKIGLAFFSILTGKGSGYGLKGAMDVTTPFGAMSLPLDQVGKTVFRK
jgi:LEA14-like dessication related protein